MKKPTKVRTNVMFPAEVLEQLRQFVPARERSEFVAQATAYKLQLLRQQQAIAHLVSAPRDEEYSDPDIEQDLRRLRQEFEEADEWRWKRLFGNEAAELKDVPPGQQYSYPDDQGT